jgi:hypothetical protein
VIVGLIAQSVMPESAPIKVGLDRDGGDLPASSFDN